MDLEFIDNQMEQYIKEIGEMIINMVKEKKDVNYLNAIRDW